MQHSELLLNANYIPRGEGGVWSSSKVRWNCIFMMTEIEKHSCDCITKKTSILFDNVCSILASYPRWQIFVQLLKCYHAAHLIKMKKLQPWNRAQLSIKHNQIQTHINFKTLPNITEILGYFCCEKKLHLRGNRLCVHDLPKGFTPLVKYQTYWPDHRFNHFHTLVLQCCVLKGRATHKNTSRNTHQTPLNAVIIPGDETQRENNFFFLSWQMCWL